MAADQGPTVQPNKASGRDRALDRRGAYFSAPANTLSRRRPGAGRARVGRRPWRATLRSIAHLTENLALSIKNTTDRSIDYRSVPRKMTSPPQRDQGYAACKSMCTLINTPASCSNGCATPTPLTCRSGNLRICRPPKSQKYLDIDVIVGTSKRLIPFTQVPLDVVSDGWARLKPRRFGARSGGARAHAGGVPARIS